MCQNSRAMTTTPPVILASSSVYRRELLSRILPGFESISPGIDESTEPGEAPADMAMRLGRQKARACAARRPDAIVIGSDQAPSLDGEVLRKPGDRNGAVGQLAACSGRSVEFLTAVTVIGPDGREESFLDKTVVRFRELGRDEIERYVDAELPFDCAGSFKIEGLGVTLFESVESLDPTALQGLPLIWLAGCLNRFGIRLP